MLVIEGKDIFSWVYLASFLIFMMNYPYIILRGKEETGLTLYRKMFDTKNMEETHYHPSGKINWSIFLSVTVAVGGLSALGGYLYSRFCNPFTFIVLITGMVILFMNMKRINFCRSKVANLSAGGILCMMAWASCFFTRIADYSNPGTQLICLLEFLLFFVPMMMLVKPVPYCEKCQQYYLNKTKYILDGREFWRLRNAEGDNPTYKFMVDLCYKDLPVKYKGKEKEIVRLEYHYCKTCTDKPIITVSSVIMYEGYSPKKGNFTGIKSKKPVTTLRYLDEKTGLILLQQLIEHKKMGAL